MPDGRAEDLGARNDPDEEESPRDDFTDDRRDPPYQALFPNLDKVSSASFDKGTLSRRNINRALILGGVLSLVIAAIIVATIVW